MAAAAAATALGAALAPVRTSGVGASGVGGERGRGRWRRLWEPR